MDGTALTQEPVAPGASFDYEFAPPDAGTSGITPTSTRRSRSIAASTAR